MGILRNPEVLAHDWMPPHPLLREAAISELTALLTEPPGLGERLPVVVEGPPGSGTSLLARWVARETAMHRRGPDGRIPHVVATRVRWCSGSTAVAGSLLRTYDEGFREHGFSIAEVMAGFIRRSLREGRPVTVLLDDLSAGCPEVGPIVRALVHPERFLPEGVEGSVPVQVILAGSGGARGAFAQVEREGVGLSRRIRLPPYSAEELRRIIEDRARSALGGPTPEGLVERLTQRAMSEGRGASRALELLRLELSDDEPYLSAPPSISLGALFPSELGRRVLRALSAAGPSGPVDLATVRAVESRLARASGDRPLAPTTFWRQIIRLEQAGVISREVRSGGPGGSRSRIRLLSPAPDGRAVTGPRGTPPRFAPTAFPFEPGWRARSSRAGAAPSSLLRDEAASAGRGPARPGRAS